ncbi:glutathione S-transferase family protein [Sedimentitalea sp. XS_ASV28]|uniref:glutathione S-transferase family protein n=1 Tax=Sedimentitalea sp. XS_ASV28 TaxID=3241296 RepID=UPI0035151F32
MYKVFGSINSRTFRVLWMLEELDQTYELIQAPPRSEVVMALSPLGKIPVFQVDDVTITDSTAIMTYLADRHGKLTFPAGSIERARQDALSNMILDELDAVLWTAARHSFVLPEDKRVPEAKPSLAWEFGRNVDRLAGLLEGPFLMGDRMTIADIIAVHCLNWAHAAKFPVENEAILGYAKSMRARDAFQRVKALVEG